MHTHTHTHTHAQTHTHTHKHTHTHTHTTQIFILVIRYIAFITHKHTPIDFAAMTGLDYTSIINMSIILSAGMQTIQISVDLNPDQLFENNERFQGILSLITTDSVSLSPGTADATIIDGEGLYMYTLCCVLA